MKKRKINFKHLFLLLGVVVALGIGSFFTVQYFFKSKLPEPLAPLANAKKMVGSEVRQYEKFDDFELDVYYPTFKNDSKNIIEDYLNEKIANYQEQNEKNQYLLIDYESFQSGDNYSVLFYQNQTNDLTDSSYQLDQIFNFDKTGNFLKLEDLFEQDYLKQLVGLLQNAFQDEFEGLPPLKFYQKLNHESLVLKDYYFNDNQIHFQFQLEELGKDSVGQVSSRSIAISDLAYFLKGDYHSTDLILKSETKVPVRYIDIKKPFIALTFDDGPSDSNSTKLIVDTLNKYQVKGTFFLLGRQIPGNEATVKLMADNGHQLGNHSYNHRDFTTLSASQIKWQLDETNALIKKATGQIASVVRLPYGAGHNHKRIKDLVPYPMIFWSVDTNDWQAARKNSELLKNYILNEAKDGSIILLHDIHPTTADTVVKVIPLLVERGYQLVTVEELAHFNNSSNYRPHQTLYDCYKK